MAHRIPPCCNNCTEPEVQRAYQKYGVVYAKVAKVIGKLVLTKRISDLEFFCTQCCWSRPDPILEHDGVTKLWYVSCKKCNERHISTEIDKCAHCDLGVL